MVSVNNRELILDILLFLSFFIWNINMISGNEIESGNSNFNPVNLNFTLGEFR